MIVKTFLVLMLVCTSALGQSYYSPYFRFATPSKSSGNDPQILARYTSLNLTLATAIVTDLKLKLGTIFLTTFTRF